MEVRLRCTGDPVTGERTISPMLAEWILIIILTTCLPYLLRFCVCILAIVLFGNIVCMCRFKGYFFIRLNLMGTAQQ